MGKQTDGYWDPKRAASYNCLFNFIIGQRGVGKTYGALNRAIDRYLKGKREGVVRQFIYLRRFSSELKELTQCRGGSLFSKVQERYPGHTLRAEGNVLFIDREVLGYAVPLSTASVRKSVPYPDVDTIIFEEFIIDNTGTYHYLANEVRKFFTFYDTVARPGTDHPDVTCWFLSNAVSLANPYFEELHLDMPYNGDIQRFGKGKEILVQNVVSRSVTESRRESRFGSIIAGTDYEEYATENKWLLDNTDFIEKKTQRCIYYASLRYKSEWLGIWYDPLQCLYYVSKDYNPEHPVKISATTDDHKPNVMLFKAAKKNHYVSAMIMAYNMGAMRYESQKLKTWFRDVMRMAKNA